MGINYNIKARTILPYSRMPIRPSLLAPLLMLLLCSVYSLQFFTTLTQNQRFCFYEVFELQQKYTFVTFSNQRSRHEIEVSHIDGRQWKSVFFRASEDNQVTLRVDKLAASSTTYSFCLKSLGDSQSTYKIQFSTGLDVMELHNLPDSTDAENLERELSWLEKQAQSLAEKSDSIEGLRRINLQINNLVGVKMIVFAVVGILVIGGVNLAFYRLLRNELKKRKLI